jgi:hypothetical protein
MQGMIEALEIPTIKEGFDEIIMLDKPWKGAILVI